MFILPCLITHSGRPSFVYIRSVRLLSWVSWHFCSFWNEVSIFKIFINFYRLPMLSVWFCETSCIQSKLTFCIFFSTWDNSCDVWIFCCADGFKSVRFFTFESWIFARSASVRWFLHIIPSLHFYRVYRTYFVNIVESLSRIRELSRGGNRIKLLGKWAFRPILRRSGHAWRYLNVLQEGDKP